MSEQVLIICRGLPASGKSTWANEWAKESPKSRVRVNRDNIRNMMGTYWVPSREKLVTKVEEDVVRAALTSGYSVVVDSTNFKYGRFVTMAEEIGVELQVEDFTDVDVEECIKRDLERTKLERVGAGVIKRMAKQHLGWKE